LLLWNQFNLGVYGHIAYREQESRCLCAFLCATSAVDGDGRGQMAETL
jgi:hypothetical protein